MRGFICGAKKAWLALPFRTSLAILLAATAGIAIGRHWLGTVCIVTGPSMWPTFKEGARLYTTPISDRLLRGDVVILEDKTDSYAIKRVVGLPGETVTIWRGYVYINDRILLEPYIPRGTYTFPKDRRAVFKMGKEEYFVLGDNRPCSADSRLYGGIPMDKIKRKIDGVLSPTPRFGPVLLTPIGEEFRRFAGQPKDYMSKL
jgi:signal peptidase I